MRIRFDGQQDGRSKREPRHGTHTEYNHYLCRCDLCRKANAERTTKYRRSDQPKNLTHGTHSSYNAGCRCAECAEANRKYWKAHHAKKRSPQGVAA